MLPVDKILTEIEKPAKKEKLSEGALLNELRQFIGTEEYYPMGMIGGPQVLATEGVHFLCEEAGCYWLIDILLSYQGSSYLNKKMEPKKIRDEYFQVVELFVDLVESSAVFNLTDGNGNVLAYQEIPYTDFPLREVKLYYTDGVVLLPSEY